MSAQPAAEPLARQRRILGPVDLALLGVVAAWGFGYVPFKIGQQEIPTGLFNLLRYVVAVPVFWIVLLRSRENWRLPARDLPRALVIGFVGVLVYSMFFAGAANITTAANVALLLALSPVWGVLLGWLAGRGAPTPRFALGSAIAFVGAAAVIGFGAGGLRFGLQTLAGDLMALAASVIWGWYGLAAQPLLKNHSGTKIQAWINLIALVGFAVYQGPAALAMDWQSVSNAAWLSVVYVALAVTVFGHLVWYAGVSRIGNNRVLLVMYLVPALAAVSGAVFLNQPLGPAQVIGGGVALAGVAMVRRS